MAGFSIGSLPGFSFKSSTGSSSSNSNPLVNNQKTSGSDATSVSFSNGRNLGRVVDSFERDGRYANAASQASNDGTSGNTGETRDDNVTYAALQGRREFIQDAQANGGLGDVLNNRGTTPEASDINLNPIERVKERQQSQDNRNNIPAAQLERAEPKNTPSEKKLWFSTSPKQTSK
ncbi:MAG: hypothetical protein R3A13_11675 [Bdellovibrionota bacterium]